MIDNLRTLLSLRPDAKFKLDHEGCQVVDGSSLKALAKTYIGSALPTQAEIDAEWVFIEFEDVKEVKRDVIRSAFAIEELQPVTVDTVIYHGGYDSASKLDGAKRLAELAGLTDISFFDTENAEHVLTIAQATAVILAVAGKYQTDFTKKQLLMTTIDVALDQSELDLVVW